MSDLNSIQLIGRLTRDPELRQTQNGTAVCNFNIANNRKFKDQEEVSFFSCVAFGGLADLIIAHCPKGKQVAIKGRLKQRTWQDQEGGRRERVEVIVEELQFLGGGRSDNQSQTGFEPGGFDPGPDEELPPF